MGRLLESLGTGPVGLDTAILIYFMEEDRRFIDLLDPLFESIDQGEIPAVTSAMTLLEVLVLPLRRGDLFLARTYEEILTRGRGLVVVDPDRPLLRSAAEIRALTGAKTADAIHLAAALRAGCKVFLTNDRRLPQLPELEILQLGDFN